MSLNDTDKFLVNRTGSSYNLEAQNLMAELLDDDLMLVNRDGVSYKATGAEIKESLDNAVPVTIETVDVSEVDPGVSARYTNKDFIAAVNCDVKSAEPIVYELKAKSEGNLVTQAKTSVITGISEDAPGVGNYIANGTITGEGFASNVGAGIDNAFDGNLTAGAFSANTGTERTTFTFGAPIPVKSSLRFYSSANPNGGAGTTDGFYVNGVNYSTLISNTSQWVTIPETTLSSFQVRNIQKIYNASVAAIEVDGNILIDAQFADANAVLEVLEFTDNTGLTEFSPGDEVEQNGGGTPQTSAITDVAGTVYSDWLSTPSGTVNTPAQGFNGDVSNGAVNSVNSTPLVWTPPGGISYSTSVEVYTGSSAQVTLRYAVNGGPTQQSCCLLYTSPSPRDRTRSRMPSSA